MQKKTLQDVLRERRGSTRLVSPVEASQRAVARRLEEVEAAAQDALGRWRDGRSPDGRGKLEPDVYRRLHALSSEAYYASGHWARRVRAQLAFAPACEVRVCGSTASTRAHHLTLDALGAELPGRDLVTLCGGCHRRARELGRELGRVPGRQELLALDPRAPLYDPARIAALKAKYAR